MSNFEREVNQRFAEGYRVVWLGRDCALHVALMEKHGDAPVEERLLTAQKDEELEAKLRASAAERFCIVYTQSTLEDASQGDRLAYLKKCDTAPEYVFLHSLVSSRHRRGGGIAADDGAGGYCLGCKTKMDSSWKSPFATIISARASRTIAELAISELIADKLPFTPSRLNAGPFASRIASGAMCGAAVCGAVKRPLAEGALLGGLGAIAGALGDGP